MKLRLPVDDPRALDLLRAWGVPYSYGAGQPRDGASAWPDGVPGISGGVGWDCSGFAQACLVRLGILPAAAPDRSSAALSELGALVALGTERLGDLVFYGLGHVSHVTVVMAPGIVLGACGGCKVTNADDPIAFVKLERLAYRGDVNVIRRFVSEPVQGTA